MEYLVPPIQASQIPYLSNTERLRGRRKYIVSFGNSKSILYTAITYKSSEGKKQSILRKVKQTNACVLNETILITQHYYKCNSLEEHWLQVWL